jgi:hypothetical protein
LKTERLTKVVHIVRFWDFILGALQSIATKTREDIDETVLKKTLINLVVDQDKAWLGIAFDKGEPIAFAVVQECTPEFETKRCMVVRWFYHCSSRFDATIALMDTFESWAKTQQITRYAVTTRRSNGEAIRCFQSARYGFGKAFLTFEKEL